MTIKERIKIGMLLVGNTILLSSAGYIIVKIFYINYLKYKNESKRLFLGE